VTSLTGGIFFINYGLIAWVKGSNIKEEMRKLTRATNFILERDDLKSAMNIKEKFFG